MEIISGLLSEIDKFIIILARFTAIGLFPFFSARNLPAAWKIAFVLLLASFGWNIGLSGSYEPPAELISFILVLINEFLIGIVLALVSQFFFASIQLAGQAIDTQMGFGIMNVVDPLSGTQSPILGNFKYIIAMLVLLQVDGHLLFLQALFDTYTFIPIGGLKIGEEVIKNLIFLFGNIFSTGFKLALPIVGSLIITDLIMGIMSRTVPQMNIFMVGMPAKIILGFGVLMAVIPLYIYLLNALIERLFSEIYTLIRLMS